MFIKKYATNKIIATVDVNRNDTIEILKTKIEKLTGIPHDQQRLILRKCELQSTRSIAHYNILSGATLFLLLRLKGGSERNEKIFRILTVIQMKVVHGKNRRLSFITQNSKRKHSKSKWKKLSRREKQGARGLYKS